MEDFRHLFVHLDHHVLLDLHLLVPRSDLMLDPVRECVLEKAGADVCDPLLWRLRKLQLRLGQVLVNGLVVSVEKLHDLLYAEAVVSICEWANMSVVVPVDY